MFVVRCRFVVGCVLVGCWLCDWLSLVVVLRFIVYCLLIVGRWLRVSCCRSFVSLCCLLGCCLWCVVWNLWVVVCCLLCAVIDVKLLFCVVCCSLFCDFVCCELFATCCV